MADEELASRPLAFREDLFAGQTFLVSGGGSGFGRAIAYVCARLGANVMICGRRPEKLEETAAGISRLLRREIGTMSMSIRDPDAVQGLIDATYARFGRLDTLVNNAGGQYPQAAIDFSVKGWLAVIDTNLNGTWYMMQAAARSAARQHRQHRRHGVARHAAGRAHLRGARRRHLPVQDGVHRMGAAEDPRQLRGLRLDRQRGAECLRARGRGDVPLLEPHARARRHVRHRPGGGLPLGPHGQVHHRGGAGGGRRQQPVRRCLAGRHARLLQGPTALTTAAARTRRDKESHMSVNYKVEWPMSLNAPADSLEAKQPPVDDGLDVPDPARYYSREFMAQEWQRLWPRVWLLAGVT